MAARGADQAEGPQVYLRKRFGRVEHTGMGTDGTDVPELYVGCGRGVNQ